MSKASKVVGRIRKETGKGEISFCSIILLYCSTTATLHTVHLCKSLGSMYIALLAPANRQNEITWQPSTMGVNISSGRGKSLTKKVKTTHTLQNCLFYPSKKLFSSCHMLVCEREVQLGFFYKDKAQQTKFMTMWFCVRQKCFGNCWYAWPFLWSLKTTTGTTIVDGYKL